MTARRRVVFVGAGHAHLHALKHADHFTRRGIEVVVIAPEDFWYSGMATGVLGGRYEPRQDQVEIAALLSAAGADARFVRDSAVAVDAAAQTVQLAGGETISYDVLSLNLGSEVQPIPGETDRVIAIKPLRNLARLRERLEHEKQLGRKVRIIVAGGGPSGCEITANLRAMLGPDGGEIVLLSGSARLASGFPSAATKRIAGRLSKLSIDVRLGAAVTRIDDDTAVTDAGERLPFDFLVNATGLRPPALLAESGLPVTERGELLVDEFLRSTGDSRIFGGGDCVKLRGRELEKIGVYAVRESPVIFENLLATLESRPLREFQPQRHCLLILNLGDGHGLARWRGFSWFGRAAFWLKDRIDRIFMARFQRIT